MLRSIEYTLRFLAWTKTKEASKKGAKFRGEPIQTPGERTQNELHRQNSLVNKAEIADMFNIKEV